MGDAIEREAGELEVFSDIDVISDGRARDDDGAAGERDRASASAPGIFNPDQRIAGVIDGGVRATFAVERIGASVAGECVVAIIPADRVVAAVADETLIAGVAADPVVTAAAGYRFNVEPDIVLFAGFAVVGKRSQADG